MVAPADRPAPPIADRGRFHRFALTAGSILIHSTLFISLWQMPNPTASLGVEVISMDVVLGANTAAGLAVAPAESETQDSVPVEEVRSEQQVAELEPVAPPEREEEKPTETPPAKQVVEVEPLPELKPPEPKKEQKQTQPSIASTASSGVGRGRSDPDTNYRGLVAAQLARHKQYPSAARSAGTQGTGTIAFTISSSGVVTSANIVKSTGVTSLDQELAAMVRRASPFPAPPGGREVSFTVPVTFRLH
jgi:protein TonB